MIKLKEAHWKGADKIYDWLAFKVNLDRNRDDTCRRRLEQLLPGSGKVSLGLAWLGFMCAVNLFELTSARRFNGNLLPKHGGIVSCFVFLNNLKITGGRI